MEPVIYLLHFESPYYHARHYLGSTTNLARRLTEHAEGRGARLTQVLFDLEENWTLARVWSPSPTHNIRNIERKAKRNHNGVLYCPFCNPSPKKLKHARVINPLHLNAGIPMSSEELTK